MNFYLRWQNSPALFRAERDKYLRRIEERYGKTGLDFYLKAESEQKGKCKVCCRKMILVADHKPRTKHFRGLLCGWCNSILGNIERMPWVVQNIQTYLGVSE